MGVGIFVVIAAEGVCRLAGWGKVDWSVDPYVSFSGVEPLFELDHENSRYSIRAERRPFFVDDGFAAQKPEKTFRVFCLGGSTVQGRPYSTATAFSTWLRLSLETAYPEIKFEVVNCGGISYASYRLVPILTECLDYAPDLIVLCTGHNEFLEDRTYPSSARRNGTVSRVMRAATESHLYRSVARLTNQGGSIDGSRPILKSEVDALLDYKRGLEVYHRNDQWRTGVIAHFEQNLRRMVSIADSAKVPMLVMAPPSNLKDCPPFRSEPGDELSSQEEMKRDALIALAEERRKIAPWEVAPLLAQASRIDPENAALHYSQGQSELAVNDLVQAQDSLEAALETDVCPLRMLAAMRVDMQKVCEETATRFFDLQGLFAATEETEILGTGILVDHIHPSVRGHQLIADRIAEELRGWLLPERCSDDWEVHRATAFENHLRSLDDLYYAHGRQRLENLCHWTEGRADGLPIESRLCVTEKEKNEE